MSLSDGLVFWKFIPILILLIFSRKTTAQSIQLRDLSLGSSIQIGSFDYVKVADNKYMQSTEVTCPDGATVGGKYVKCFESQTDYATNCTQITMQNFTSAMCAAFTTPKGADYVEVGWLQDNRDGKWYEIRKFSDGVCWMVTNLKYGGITDACASRTGAEFDGDGSASPTNRFGTGTYGDCRNNPSSSDYGYLYNWQAAMQSSSAYNGNNYTGSQTNVRGLCPSGWVLPTSNSTTRKGSFGYLHVKAGSPITGFWQEGNWKGLYSGAAYGGSGEIHDVGSGGFYWSSTQSDTERVYYLNFDNTSVTPATSNNPNKASGHSIRCIHF